jgi:hypothetical protein
MERQISELSVVELKALAYDQMAQLQQCQNNINVINQELAKRLSPQPQQSPPEPPPSVPTYTPVGN